MGKRSKKPRSRAQLFRAFLCKGGRLHPFADLPLFLAAGRLTRPFGRKPPADMGNARKAKGAKLQLFGRFCALGMRRGLSPCPGKQEPCVGLYPEPAAGVRDAGKKRHGARFAHRRCACVRDTGRKKTRCVNCPAQPRELLAAGAGFLPARENRSRARARTRNQPRACETRGRKRHGARLARRSRATCSPQVRAFLPASGNRS